MFATVKVSDNNPVKAYCELTPIGCVINNIVANYSQSVPLISIPAYVIMPDHIHLVLFVKESGKINLSDIVRNFKSYCTSGWNQYCKGESAGSVFLKGFHDRIVKRKRQYSIL